MNETHGSNINSLYGAIAHGNDGIVTGNGIISHGNEDKLGFAAPGYLPAQNVAALKRVSDNERNSNVANDIGNFMSMSNFARRPTPPPNAYTHPGTVERLKGGFKVTNSLNGFTVHVAPKPTASFPYIVPKPVIVGGTNKIELV